jgi:MscS family membrane protein
MHQLIQYIFPNLKIEIIAALNITIYILVALLFKYFIIKILSKILNKTKNQFDDNVFELIKNPIFEAIILIGLYNSINFLNYSNNIINILEKSIISFLTIVWIILIFKVSNLSIRYFINKNSKHHIINTENLPLIINLIKTLLLIIAVIVILSSWNLDLTPLLASAGIISVIIGFAAKDFISNFLGGISVIIDKPYRIGDWIELDQKERGEVVDIGLRSTRIRTRDDILIAIPNSIISNTKIINESAPFPDYRLRLPIALHYNSDLNLVEEELINIACKIELVLEDPKPRVRFRELGSSTINCELLCWTNQPAERGFIIHTLIKHIYSRFRELNIDFPYQQIDINLKNKE